MKLVRFTVLGLILAFCVRAYDAIAQLSAAEQGQVDSEYFYNDEIEKSKLADRLERSLSEIAERQRQLDGREGELEVREAEMSKLAKSIDAKIQELKNAEDTLIALQGNINSAAENDIDTLTVFYEKMKPKDAAEVFEVMDDRLASGFIARLNPDIGARILSIMSPEKAYSISTIIAGRNAID